MPMARITTLAHQRLQKLAAKRGVSQLQVLDDALELLDRRHFFEEAHRQYEELRQDSSAAADFDRERVLFDGTLSDGADH